MSRRPLSPNSEDYESNNFEEHDGEFQKNGVSRCPLSPNSKDYESNNDEECDDEFQKNGVSQCPLSPDSKDCESSSDEARDDDFQEIGVSQSPLSLDSKDYESNSDEEQDESSSDDPMMEMLPRNIVSRSRSRPFRINANYSSYTRGRAEYLTRRSSTSALITYFSLLRIKEKLEKYPTFYLEVRHKRQFGLVSNTAMSWMKDFFSKHGECMPNRETIHIPDNFSR